jgi:pSer/pThr/pTyr-binding forkhead associated (FHA) protein
LPEPLLNLLKILLLVLLYLFFFRVLRAVWTEVNPPKAAPVRAGKAAKNPRRPSRQRGKHGVACLRVVEPADQKGRQFELGDEMTVGRAAGCQVTLDDTFVSQLHARVFTRDGQILVEDLGSTNGTYLNRRKVAGPMVMSRGDQLQIGSTVMELT